MFANFHSVNTPVKFILPFQSLKVRRWEEMYTVGFSCQCEPASIQHHHVSVLSVMNNSLSSLVSSLGHSHLRPLLSTILCEVHNTFCYARNILLDNGKCYDANSGIGIWNRHFLFFCTMKVTEELVVLWLWLYACISSNPSQVPCLLKAVRRGMLANFSPLFDSQVTAFYLFS